MRLAVIIPCLNEEATISEVISAIPDSIQGIADVEVIVIDDGSTDKTPQLAEGAGAKVVSHTVNKGVGAAFQTGIDAALKRNVDIIVNMDGDGQFNPSDIPTLIQPILAGEADFVTCTRFGRSEWMPTMPGIKLWGNRMMCRIINFLISDGPFTDVSCGFRAYSRETALKLNLHGDFTYTQESFIDLAGKQTRMVEVPLKVRGVREHGSSRVASNLWKYAARSSLIILRAARDVKPLQMFGTLAVLLFLLGLFLGGGVFFWWVITGRTHPFRSVLYGSSTSFIMSFVIGVLSLLADMTGRIRKNQEKILSLLKRKYYRDQASNQLED